MSDDKKYNGWSNYETWNWKLWMDNDQGTQEYFSELAQSCYDEAEADSISIKGQSAIYDLSKILKDYADENNPLPEAGCYTDLLNAAL
jgi:hypothetical protein